MTNSNQELFERIETMKVALVTTATGGSIHIDTGHEYSQLRIELMENGLTKSLVPHMVKSCRNLSEFWAFIRDLYPHYQQRREFIRKEFDPILTALETSGVAPADKGVSNTLKAAPSAFVHEAWERALARRSSDPEGAITAARTLIESVCKLVLEETGIVFDEGADLPKLYKKAASSLNLAPDQHTEQLFKQILGGCQAVVEGLGGLRNKLSDAHGRGRNAIRPLPRHAELAVNLAGATATFLVSTLGARKNQSE